MKDDYSSAKVKINSSLDIMNNNQDKSNFLYITPAEIVNKKHAKAQSLSTEQHTTLPIDATMLAENRKATNITDEATTPVSTRQRNSVTSPYDPQTNKRQADFHYRQNSKSPQKRMRKEFRNNKRPDLVDGRRLSQQQNGGVIRQNSLNSSLNSATFDDGFYNDSERHFASLPHQQPVKGRRVLQRPYSVSSSSYTPKANEGYANRGYTASNYIPATIWLANEKDRKPKNETDVGLNDVEKRNGRSLPSSPVKASNNTGQSAVTQRSIPNIVARSVSLHNRAEPHQYNRSESVPNGNIQLPRLVSKQLSQIDNNVMSPNPAMNVKQNGGPVTFSPSHRYPINGYGGEAIVNDSFSPYEIIPTQARTHIDTKESAKTARPTGRPPPGYRGNNMIPKRLSFDEGSAGDVVLGKSSDGGRNKKDLLLSSTNRENSVTSDNVFFHEMSVDEPMYQVNEMNYHNSISTSPGYNVVSRSPAYLAPLIVTKLQAEEQQQLELQDNNSSNLSSTFPRALKGSKSVSAVSAITEQQSTPRRTSLDNVTPAYF